MYGIPPSDQTRFKSVWHRQKRSIKYRPTFIARYARHYYGTATPSVRYNITQALSTSGAFLRRLRYQTGNGDTLTSHRWQTDVGLPHEYKEVNGVCNSTHSLYINIGSQVRIKSYALQGKEEVTICVRSLITVNSKRQLLYEDWQADDTD